MGRVSGVAVVVGRVWACCLVLVVCGAAQAEVAGQAARGVPRVLLIGDSICRGYGPYTIDLLAGSATVVRSSIAGGSSANLRQVLDRCLGRGPWDVVHFNCGLHDCLLSGGSVTVPLSQYQTNLHAIVDRLEQTGARLIFATTTPVSQDCNRRRRDIVTYNAAASAIMRQRGVQVDDLYSFILPQLTTVQQSDHVHYTERGSELLGGEVARSIQRCLGLALNGPPSPPRVRRLEPANPTTADELQATVGQGAGWYGHVLRYQCLWERSLDGGSSWQRGPTGLSLPAAETRRGERWRFRARSLDGATASRWASSSSVVIANALPSLPEYVQISPRLPMAGETLRGVVSPLSDADGDELVITWQWWRSNDGRTYRAGPARQTVSGTATRLREYWKVAVQASDGQASGPWTFSDPVRIGNHAPAAPQSIGISTIYRGSEVELRALARGASDPDGDTVSYRYRWHKSSDSGQSWVAGPEGQTLLPAEAAQAPQWKVWAVSFDGVTTGGGRWSAPLWIRNARVAALGLSATGQAVRDGMVQIVVNLAAAAEVEVQVRNLAGRAVAALPARTLPQGVSTLLWEGRGTHGTAVPPGRYLLEIRARGTEGAAVSALAAVQVR